VTDLAPVLQGFFTDRLARQKKASPNTIAAYRDTLRLLLAFARDRTGKPPSTLSLADLDATLIGAFLQHLEDDRGNGSATPGWPRSAPCSPTRHRGHQSTPP
jgi:site-specific recombinase XerD